METSEVQIFPIRQQGTLVAFGSFLANNSLRISGIALHTGKEGKLRIVFPAKKVGNGYVYYCQPLNQEIKRQIELVFEEKAKEVGLFDL